MTVLPLKIAFFEPQKPQNFLAAYGGPKDHFTLRNRDLKGSKLHIFASLRRKDCQQEKSTILEDFTTKNECFRCILRVQK